MKFDFPGMSPGPPALSRLAKLEAGLEAAGELEGELSLWAAGGHAMPFALNKLCDSIAACEEGKL